MKNLAALLALSLFALVACNGQGITVKGPKNSKSTTINVIPAPTITGLSCVPAEVYEGDSVTCTLTVDRAAPVAGFTFPVLGGVGNPTSVTVPSGQTLVTFTFAAVINGGAPPVAAWHPMPSPMHWTQAGVDAYNKRPLPLGIASAQVTTKWPWVSIFYYRFL